MVQQADGKIVAVGSSTDGTTINVDTNLPDEGPPTFEQVNQASRSAPDIIVARFNADGSLDQTFGSHGQVRLDFGGAFISAEEAFAVAMDGGNIVIGGHSAESNTAFNTATMPADYDVTLVRLTPLGALDTTFGNNGVARVDFGSANEAVRGLAVLPDHSIVTTGTTGENVFVAKFTSAGALDPTFGTAGKTVTDLGGSDQANALLIDGSGRIVIAGSDGLHFAAARYFSTGVLDTTFGSHGIEILVSPAVPASVATANAIALDSHQNLVLAGGAFGVNGTLTGYFAVARLTPNGQIDTTFGTNGLALNSFSSVSNNYHEQALSVMVDSAGRINVTGSALPGLGNGDLVATRLLASGALDTSFGTNGAKFVDFGADDTGGAGMIDSQGHLIVVGTTDNQKNPDAAIAQLNTNGVLDTTWGQGGLMTTDFLRGSDAQPETATLQANGSVIIAGSTRSGFSGADFALVRFNADGSIDTNFGNNGRVVTDFGGGERITSLVIEPDQSIIAVGETLRNNLTFEIDVAKYTPPAILTTTSISILSPPRPRKLLTSSSARATAPSSPPSRFQLTSSPPPSSPPT